MEMIPLSLLVVATRVLHSNFAATCGGFVGYVAMALRQIGSCVRNSKSKKRLCYAALAAAANYYCCASPAPYNTAIHD
jgi:hypothetical protein